MFRWIFAALALAIPFAAFAIYRALARKRGPAPWPAVALWLGGVALAVEALLLFAIVEGMRAEAPNGYVPPPRDQPALYDREPPPPEPAPPDPAAPAP